MNGEMNSLKDVEYNLSHDINTIKDLNYQQLALVKSEIESELNKLFEVLQKNKVSMDSALITHDGFPRSDVNVIEIRNVRVKIIKLRNDLTIVINELSEKLHSQFQNTEPEKKIDNDLLIPFAKVTEVVDSGPAAQAGIRVDDKIVIFGTINVTNHNHLQNIGLIVKNNVNKPIEIKVLRGSQKLHLEIKPTSDWPGNGLLGCRIIQI